MARVFWKRSNFQVVSPGVKWQGDLLQGHIAQVALDDFPHHHLHRAGTYPLEAQQIGRIVEARMDHRDRAREKPGKAVLQTDGQAAAVPSEMRVAVADQDDLRRFRGDAIDDGILCLGRHGLRENRAREPIRYRSPPCSPAPCMKNSMQAWERMPKNATAAMRPSAWTRRSIRRSELEVDEVPGIESYRRKGP